MMCQIVAYPALPIQKPYTLAARDCGVDTEPGA
jgi:hypothetical protein